MAVFSSSHSPASALCAAALAALALGACSSVDNATRSLADAVTFYKPEVVQGNFVSREQVQALRTGMTRVQVRDILGTPLMASVFHADRWDYVFTLKRQRVQPQQYRLTVFFEGDQLARFEGDDMPSEAEFVQRISSQRKAKIPSLEASEEQLARFAESNMPASGATDVAAADAPAAVQDAVAPPAGGYPPLE